MSENEEKRTTIELSGRAIERQMIYDLQVDDPNEVCKVLHLSPVSEEGDAVERKDSDKRLAEIEHLAELFDHQARGVAAAAMITTVDKLKEKYPEVQITDDFVVATYQQHKAVAYAAIYAGVSTLMGNGVITWGSGTNEQ